MNTEIKTLVGVLEDRQSKEGSTNGKAWKRYVLKINGITLSTFDSECEDLPLNSTVEVKYLVEGQYNNIINIEASEGSVQTPIPATDMKTTTPPKVNIPSTNQNTESSIVSQVLIKAVTEMVCAGKIEIGKFKDNASVLANIYKETKKTLLE